MTADERGLFERALYVFGPSMQEGKLLEEMAELQVEIMHHRIGRGDVRRIAEEIADVGIVLDQMILLFGIGQAVKEKRAQKVERLRQRVFQEEDA